jgi:transcriptional regulator of acetoin/glycerol metabolism
MFPRCEIVTKILRALAAYFLEQSHPGMRLSFGALEALQGYSWPAQRPRTAKRYRSVLLYRERKGNRGGSTCPVLLLRHELNVRNAAARTCARCSFALEDIEKQAIIRALARTGGHQSIAAEQLGISRRTL